MSDEASRIIGELSASPPLIEDPELTKLFPASAFNEAAYLAINPDVAAAISRGEVRSAYAHFINYGLREGRLPPGVVEEPRNRLIKFAADAGASAAPLAQNIESLMVSPTGAVFIIGWADDSAAPIDCIRIIGAQWRLTLDGASLLRNRRDDVREALGIQVNHPFGFCGFVFSNQKLDGRGEFRIEIRARDGRQSVSVIMGRTVEDVELRNTALGHVVGTAHFGNAHIRSITYLNRGMGAEIVNHNRSITRKLLVHPYVERFGPRTKRPLGSIIVCLYGKLEYFFLQSALFSAGPGIRDYEFVYVSNSPELAEGLIREARIASTLYGLDQTVVILPGNAGFGGANNAAVAAAASDRLLIVNPDVFPYDADWAAKHTALITERAGPATRLFGVPLFYDDGSLMHGGMYFDLDAGATVDGDRTYQWQLLRVEHYGKGAPPGANPFMHARPVPAVTGAFISVDRQWFEKLGGFTEDYVFGHYEDADLCLKSLRAGFPAWLHDIKLWHLEGKGSTRLPAHEGGSLVNRWLFSTLWGAEVAEDLLGPKPTHPAFEAQPEPLAEAPAALVSAARAKGAKVRR